MQKTAYKLIAEAFREIYEVSSTGDIIKNLPGGNEVMQTLHSQMGAPHDIKYNPEPKISWADIKGTYRGSWILIQGDKGSAAIRWDGTNYTSVASAGAGVETFKNSRSNFTVDFLKGKIGGLRKFWVAKGVKDTGDVKRDRASRQADPAKQGYTQSSLGEKFKPLVVKTIQAAQADIRGMAMTMLKNGNNQGAIKKIQKLESYEEQLHNLQSKNGRDDLNMNTRVSDAAMLAAHHFYPEQTGEVTRSRYGRGLNIENQQGVQQLFNDINAGQMDKLSVLLQFFKRSFTA